MQVNILEEKLSNWYRNHISSDDDWSGGLEGGLKVLGWGSLDGLDLGELKTDLGVGSGVLSSGIG